MLNTLFNALKAKALAEPTSTVNGINIGIDTDTVNDAIQAILPWAEHRMNQIKVPDLILPSDTTMYMKQNDFTITQTPD